MCPLGIKRLFFESQLSEVLFYVFHANFVRFGVYCSPTFLKPAIISKENSKAR